MAQFNPALGGPAYADMLGVALSAWELQSPYRPTPPAAGGEQFSVRIGNERKALIDAIAARSGWNRNQVLVALIDSTIAHVFIHLNDPTANRIRDDMMATLFPGSGSGI